MQLSLTENVRRFWSKKMHLEVSWGEITQKRLRGWIMASNEILILFETEKKNEANSSAESRNLSLDLKSI